MEACGRMWGDVHAWAEFIPLEFVGSKPDIKLRVGVGGRGVSFKCQNKVITFGY